jgi:nucleoside-diphosphate kinase
MLHFSRGILGSIINELPDLGVAVSEKTFVMVKPDGVARGLTGEIIRRIEQRGLKIVALKMFQATRKQIDGHYPKDDVWVNRLGEKSKSTYEKYGYDMQEKLGTTDTMVVGKMVREWILDFMTSAPVVTMVVEGLHAVDMVRKLAGPTIPALAEVGTIRGDYSVDSPALANSEKRALANLVHASETPEEAAHEIGYWFKPEELVSYRRGEADTLLNKSA